MTTALDHYFEIVNSADNGQSALEDLRDIFAENVQPQRGSDREDRHLQCAQ
jgi:hypothetical protein